MSVENGGRPAEKLPWYVELSDSKPTFWSTVLMLFGVLALTAGVGLMTYAICRMCDADPHSATDWALLSAMAAAAACVVATTVTAELSYNYRLRQKQQLQPPEPEQYRLW